MKFLCSFLILAGVFALNVAFPSGADDEMRLAKDELILEDLKLMVADRSSGSSVQCSQDYLQELTTILDNYNSLLKGCEDAAQTTTDELNKGAMDKIKGFNSNIAGTCSNECPADSEASVGLDCIEEMSSKNSRSLSEISVQASSIKVELQKAIEDAQGIKDVCVQSCYSTYVTDSQTCEDKFKKCVQSKSESE